jgi:hypothetical protein
LLVLLVVGLLLVYAASRHNLRAINWTERFALEPDELASVGRNPFFILEPGHALVLEAGTEQLTITVLPETRMIGPIETRVVEERETNHGELIEVSRNYMAISKRTNGVFYFGEDVDIYRDGGVVSHEGAWLHGVNGARFGLMMPGLPLLKARYYQEIAPGIALDRAEIVSLTDTMVTRAGVLRDLLKVAESSPLEPRVRSYKYYAADIGLVRDGNLRLVRYQAADTAR